MNSRLYDKKFVPIKLYLVVICLLPLGINALLFSDSVYIKVSRYTTDWLTNQNEIYVGAIKRFFSERQSDINLLSVNISSDFVQNQADDQSLKSYLELFVSSYGYKSLVILNSNREVAYDSSGSDDDFLSEIKSFSHKIDAESIQSTLFDYFRVNNQLYGVLGKKKILKNGQGMYFFLTVDNEALNDLLSTSTVNVTGMVSYLVNKNADGDYVFLTDVIQDEQHHKYGSLPEHLPLYWKDAEKEIIKPFHTYVDLGGKEVLVAHSVIKLLGENFTIITKLKKEFLSEQLLESMLFNIVGVALSTALLWISFIYSKRFIQKNTTEIKYFCASLVEKGKVNELKLSKFFDDNIKQDLLYVANHLLKDGRRKSHEIKMETYLRPSKNLKEFAQKTIELFDEIMHLHFGAFYLKEENQFTLLSKRFTAMADSIPIGVGIIGQSYEINKVTQIRGNLVGKHDAINGGFVDFVSHAIYPPYHIVLPVVASRSATCSGVLVLGCEDKLSKNQLVYLEKIRVNLALIMSFVEQKESIQSLLEITKSRENELAKVNKELTHLSRNDALTGIYNRFYGEHLLNQALEDQKGTQAPLSVLMFDVDHFKLFNDCYGHVAGDQCLNKVAQCMVDMGFRDDDFFFRYGGEEFIVCLPNTSLNDAKQVAERLRSAVQEMAIPHEKSLTSDVLTISLGVYTNIPNQSLVENIAQLIEEVDKNLYIAKTKRNAVFASGDISTVAKDEGDTLYKRLA